MKMNEKNLKISNIKQELDNLREIFDYFMDSYGLPDKFKEFDFDSFYEIIEKLILENKDSDLLNKNIRFKESEALNDLVYIFLLDSLNRIEEELAEINIKKRNIINIKEKMNKFINQRQVLNDK